MGMDNGGTALFAYIRMLYIGSYICMNHLSCIYNGNTTNTNNTNNNNTDTTNNNDRVDTPNTHTNTPIDCLIIDGVSIPIPLFVCCNIPTMFYCHYPDKVSCCVYIPIYTYVYL